MNRLTSQQRKLAYLACIVVLLVPVIILGRPSAPASRGAKADAGGVLATLRTEHDLGEQSFGNVDPSSATMNLILLGLRGPAANLLWIDLERAKDTKNWARCLSLTNSIILLQPHFQKVWAFNGWNLAYNISVEWDDVRDRYLWVKEGAKFFKKGTVRNDRFTELFWYTGDTIGKKIGRSDEWEYFRQFFLRDPDPKYNVNNEAGPDPELNPDRLDNYAVAKEWYIKAREKHKAPKSVKQHILDESLFLSYPARAEFDMAIAQQKEGIFSKDPWERGFTEWTQVYGQEQILVKATGLERQIFIQLESTLEDIKRRATSEEEQKELIEWTDRYQKIANYPYWRMRALAEAESETAEAHKDLYDAGQAYIAGDTPKSEELAFQGLTRFEKLTERYPNLLTDETSIEEMMIGQFVWRESYRQNNAEDFPETYPLRNLWIEQQPRVQDYEKEFIRRYAGLNR
ncbi:MAG: hypothetical protein KDA68_03375 [Planctomycetaceae bacterium]|nr:hypothetical protein [Planctomycetaceae bacterium]